MRKRETDPEKLKERYYKQLDRQKKYNAYKYDHISLNFPAGYKQKIAERVAATGAKNTNEYFKALFDQDNEK